MKDIIVVEQPQSMEQMNHYLPYLDLGHHLLLTFDAIDLFAKITLLGVLHYDAQTFNVFVEKCFIVANNVGRTKRGKQSYLI